MNPCKYFDDGWCYAPDDVETGAHQGACCASFCSYYIKKQQMTINLHDYVNKKVIVTYRNGVEVVCKVYYNINYSDYPYRIFDRWYTRDGRVLIDQEYPLDIVNIITVEENDKNFENSKQIVDNTMTEDNTKRASGRTLGLALQAIGKAVENPGTEVEFIDHYAQKYSQLSFCKKRIEILAEKLGLDISVDIRSNKLDDRFRPEPYSIFVKSNWVPPYAKRTPAEESWKNYFGEYPNETDTTWKYFNIGFSRASK